MHRLAFLAAALALLSPAAAAVSLVEGEARAADDSALLYRESHYVVAGAAPERWVLYRCPDGRPFARKHVRGGGAAPDFALEDGRDGHREGVRRDGARRIATLGGRQAALAAPADAVIDAGFDAAVRLRWNELMSGDVVRLRFLVPSRQRFVPVRVRRVGATTWRGVRAERLRMGLDAWFGFAVPDVELVYAHADQRLLEFRGTGNVRDARGDHPQVRIAFAQPPAAAAPGAIEALRRMPLDGTCRF